MQQHMKNFHVDERDHQQTQYNYYSQNAKADGNQSKVSLLVILVHIFYKNQYVRYSNQFTPFVVGLNQTESNFDAFGMMNVM